MFVSGLNLVLAFFVWISTMFMGGLVVDYFMGGSGWWSALGFIFGTVVFVTYSILTMMALWDDSADIL